MTDITIPPEALEAAAKALADEYYGDEISAAEKFWPEFKTQASIACLAMLAHWPGKHVGPSPADARRRSLILPLPQEPEA